MKDTLCCRSRPAGRCSVIPPLLASNEPPCAGGENAPRSATLGPIPYPDSRLGQRVFLGPHRAEPPAVESALGQGGLRCVEACPARLCVMRVRRDQWLSLGGDRR